MRSQIIYFLSALILICTLLIQEIAASSELGLEDYVYGLKENLHQRRDTSQEDITIFKGKHHLHNYPYGKYDDDSIILTKIGRPGSITTLKRTDSHERPDSHRDLHHDRLPNVDKSELVSDVIGEHLHSYRRPHQVLAEHEVVDTDAKKMDKELVELKIIQQPVRKIINGDVYEKIGYYRPKSSYLDEVDLVQPHSLGKKIVDVKVVKYEPKYEILLPRQNLGVQSDDALVKDSIKLPSVALKERETIYSGGEHRFSSDHSNKIYKKVNTCGC